MYVRFIFVGCIISRIHGADGETLHSPTTIFHGDDLFLSENDLSAVEELPDEDVDSDDGNSFFRELEMIGI